MIKYPISFGCAVFSFTVSLFCIAHGDVTGFTVNALCAAFNTVIALGGLD